MKKIYLSLILLSAGITAQAQRTIRLRLQILNPASQDNMTATSIISPSYIITNLGPDPIIPGDTLIYQHSGDAVARKHLLTHTVNINHDEQVPLNEIVFGKADWVMNFDSIQTLYTTDMKSLLSKPFTANKKYAWYLQVKVVPQKGMGTISTSTVTDTVHIWIDRGPTAIGEVFSGNEMIRTYPNPAANRLSFDYNFTTAEKATVSIMDITGRAVMTKEIESKGSGTQQFDLDISSIRTGNYFLRLTAGEKTMLSRFAIQQ